MGEVMRQHHDLAMGKDVDVGVPKHTATGELNPISDDTRAKQAGGHGHVHETDPARDAGHQHGDHDHDHMHSFHPERHHGGHKHMHEFHPSDHDGGHGEHRHFGRKKNF